MLASLALLVLTLAGAAPGPSHPLDKSALADELRTRDEIEREWRFSHPLSPEVRVGDLLTLGAIALSAAGLLIASARDRALRRRDYADRIRNSAGLIVVKADRWREIAAHFFAEMQPVIVDTDFKLKSESTETIRDAWWKEAAVLRAKTLKAILEEEIENAYLNLYSYDPSIKDLFLGAMSTLRAIDRDVHKNFLTDTQEIIFATTLPYFSSKLGNPLRRSCETHRRDLDRRMGDVISDLRDHLAVISSATDGAIVERRIALGASTSGRRGVKPGGPETAAPERWAVLVGIDHCPKIVVSPLQGPGNDVSLLGTLLREHCGFSPHCIRFMVNAQATRSQILDALVRLTAETNAGDLVFFYFSGNGSLFTPSSDRPRKVLATLVPYDSGRDEGQNLDISETEINRYLNGLAKDRRLIVVLDTCHSGGIAERQHAFPDVQPAEDAFPTFAPRGLGPPTPAASPTTVQLAPGIPLAGRYTLLSACGRDEQAYEVLAAGGMYHGAFTFSLAAALSQAARSTSYEELLQTVTSKVHDYQPEQNPQIEGDGARTLAELFGVQAG
jgi:hypothetical protein